LRAAEQDLYARLAAHSRVVLTGEGGDPGLVGSPEAIVRLLRTGKLWNLAAGYVRCALWQRSVPRVGLRSLFRSGIRAEENTSVPEWINPQLASKLDLPRRASQLEEEENVLPSNHPRPKAYKILAKAEWANTFELYDPGNSPRPVEARHPFFDVRLLEFLLSLPTLPWCVGKQMIREGMAGFLPKEVLRRRKAPLAGDPVVELLKQPQSGWVDSFQPTSELLHYVNPSRIPSIVGRQNFSSNSWLHLRPLILDHWLRMQVRVGYKDRV
jgi:asparagine synthase (glutamine-hydrolysing)